MGVVISVANNKGGVGKSTTTYNLADALGKKGKRVLVIDMDSQCNTTSVLLPSSVAPRNSLYDILNPKTLIESLNPFIYMTELTNVVLIPNDPDTSTLEPNLISMPEDQRYLTLRTEIREHAIKNYDFTLIDTPPNMGTFVMMSLHASDFCIVPIKAGSAFSVEGLVKATKLINNIRVEGNPDLRFLRLLINNLDKRTAISKAIVDQLHRVFEVDQIFKTTIPVNTAFERAESLTQTIFQYDGTTPGAKAFRDLAKELISILEG